MTPLIDAPNYYVTLCGRVFVKERKELLYNRHPKPYYRTYPEKELKQTVSSVGYKVVGITVSGKRHTCSVHRLVAQCFIPNPYKLPEVNHKDANKLNNKVSNLEWCNRKGNLDHAAKLGLKNIGSKVGTSKLDEEDVLMIMSLLEMGTSQTTIANIFNVSNHCIYRIAHGFNWGWLTGYGGRKVAT